VVGRIRCSLLCKFAPLTRHISICFLRYRIECILSETLVFKCTSEEAFPIFCIHFLAKFSSFVLNGRRPGQIRSCGRAVLPQACLSTMPAE
jgi:hypothetical protein